MNSFFSKSNCVRIANSRLFTVNLLACAALYIFGASQILQAQESLNLTAKEARFGVSLKSGLAVFPDLQVPQSDVEESRADGTLSEQNSSLHSGFPVAIGLNYFRRWEALFAGASFDVMHIASNRGGGETDAATYFRTEVSGRLGLDQTIMANSKPILMNPVLYADLAWRRSRFMNVSTGHFVDSILPKLGLQLSTDDGRFSASAEYGISVLSQFKFYPGKLGSASSINDSKASLSEMKVSAAWQFYSMNWLEVGFEQEQARVSIPNVENYDKFGLTVIRAFTSSQQETLLSTRSYFFGVRRQF